MIATRTYLCCKVGAEAQYGGVAWPGPWELLQQRVLAALCLGIIVA
jgi:hypothetical protein